MTTTPPEPDEFLDARAIEQKLARQDEIWECQIAGRVHVATTNHLGRSIDKTVKGKGARLRLSALDRELAEEQIRNIHHNPFRNGMLVQVGGVRPASDDTRPQSISDDDLKQFFAVKDEEGFGEICDELSELNLRRLSDLAADSANEATMTQGQIIATKIQERFAIGGDTPTWREMMGEDATSS